MEKQNESDKEPVITIQGVYKSFGDLHILKNVTIDLYKGENLVVLGRSGTGKSVLIKMIIGLLFQDRGIIRVLGQEVNKLKQKELDALRLRIGFAFQSTALYDSMNVRQNLEFPLVMNKKNLTRDEINKSVEDVLNAVGLLDKIDAMPSDLSGGQKKRIGIARTLILEPEIMLYDEPTAGLDPISSEDINNLINEVKEKYHTSSIIITHDLACAKQVGDRVAMLFEGKFIKIGSFEEVFETQNKQIQSFYNYKFI